MNPPHSPTASSSRLARRVAVTLVAVASLAASACSSSEPDEAVARPELPPIPAPEVVYAPPLVITVGGTYTGAWESTDATVPAVLVATSEPVIIEDAAVRGFGDIIAVASDQLGADITVRNTYGEGTGPGDRRFLQLDGDWSRVVVENNDLVNTSGMWFHAAEPTEVRIVGNRVRNVIGAADSLVQAMQFDKVVSPSIEIAWNEIINELGASGVEDVISFYDSGGVPGSPIRVHDNFIWGAFPEDRSDEFSGGGIMVGDQGSDVGHVVVEGNHVVGTTNYGISVVCGSDQQVRDNIIVSSGRTPDGEWLDAANVGLSLGSEAHWGAGCTTYERNSASGNQLAWQVEDGRNDSWTPDCSDCSGNESRPDDSDVDEYAEYEQWLEHSADQQIGRTSTTT